MTLFERQEFLKNISHSHLPRKEFFMLSDAASQKKSWEELTTSASREKDSEKLAFLMEEIFAALEEREQNRPQQPESSSNS